MNSRNRQPDPTHELYKAMLLLESAEECYRFLCDLCTMPELKAMEQRYEVAKLLSEGGIYSDIVEQTGASTATISRVKRSLHYGMNSYATLFQKMEDEK